MGYVDTEIYLGEAEAANHLGMPQLYYIYIITAQLLNVFQGSGPSLDQSSKVWTYNNFTNFATFSASGWWSFGSFLLQKF